MRLGGARTLKDFAMVAAPSPDLVTAAAALLAAIASVGSAAAALNAALRSRPEATWADSPVHLG